MEPPPNTQPEPHPSHGKPPPADWFATVKAKRVDKLSVYDRRNAVCHALNERSHKLFTCLEADPEGGWRVHGFALSPPFSFVDPFPIWRYREVTFDIRELLAIKQGVGDGQRTHGIAGLSSGQQSNHDDMYALLTKLAAAASQVDDWRDAVRELWGGRGG